MEGKGITRKVPKSLNHYFACQISCKKCKTFIVITSVMDLITKSVKIFNLIECISAIDMKPKKKKKCVRVECSYPSYQLGTIYKKFCEN